MKAELKIHSGNGRNVVFLELLHSLAKDRVELFGDVVIFVFDIGLAQFDSDVWICFSIDIRWVQVSSLQEKYQVERFLFCFI